MHTHKRKAYAVPVTELNIGICRRSGCLSLCAVHGDCFCGNDIKNLKGKGSDGLGGGDAYQNSSGSAGLTGTLILLKLHAWGWRLQRRPS